MLDLETQPKTGIIIPCYNEAERLSVQDFIVYLKQQPNIFFCFVNDGSSDKTQEILASLAQQNSNNISVLHLKQNQGKAEAIRQGLKHLIAWQDVAFVGYWDADLATPLDEIVRFVAVFQKLPQVHFVCGSRIRKMGTFIERSWHRHYSGRVFATLVSLMLQLPIYDSQCGAKLIKTPLAEKLFAQPFYSSWFFDVELLFRTIKEVGTKQALHTIYEIPLHAWEDKEGSKLQIYDVLLTPWELLKIFWHYHR